MRRFAELLKLYLHKKRISEWISVFAYAIMAGVSKTSMQASEACIDIRLQVLYNCVQLVVFHPEHFLHLFQGVDHRGSLTGENF